MERLPQDPDCPLLGTRYCRMLNMRSCDRCVARDCADTDAIIRDLDEYERLLPDGGIAGLFQARECRFCRGETKGRRAGFAIMDMAHPAPQRVQRWVKGGRVRALGTMIPVQMAVCHDCRRRFLQAEYIPVLAPLMVSALALILCAAGPVHAFLAARAAILPFLTWAAVSAAMAFAATRMRKALVRRFDRHTRMDVRTDPAIRQMLDKGWVNVGKRTGSRLLFSKSRLARGLGTATDGMLSGAEHRRESGENGENERNKLTNGHGC